MTLPSGPVRLSGTNLERAADHNQRVTLHAIRVTGSLTRIDLARITGLTPPAIANITKRLLSEGLIAEAGRRLGGRGQPPTKLVINPSACYAVGINVDRDHITIVIVNFLGETIARVSREVEFALPGDVKVFYEEQIGQLIEEARINPRRIVGVGVARPDDLGSVDLPDRPPAYAQWNDVDLVALFAEPLRLPVFVENDAAAAAMGELQLGLGQQSSSFFYILISWGLGGGLVIDGSYYRGADGRSGEVGFLLSENIAGSREPVQRLVSLSGLSLALNRAGYRVADLMCETVDAKVHALVNDWIEEAVERLIEPLISINCLINPAAIFIGGRLPKLYVSRMAERLGEVMRERAGNAPAMAPVRRAMLAEDAPAVGAAILPFSHFLLPKPNALWKSPAPERTDQSSFTAV